MKRNTLNRRNELGRISLSTLGSVYGTVERIGLFQAATELNAR